MIKLFVLVVSLWGYNGTEWVYVGNQMVFNNPMQKKECETMGNKLLKYELNKYYRFSIECIEAHNG